MKLVKRLEDIFGTVAFAEAGEFETTARMIDKSKDKSATNNTDEHSETQKDIEVAPSPSMT